MPNNLSYPLNVEGDDQQGHYIMFMINEVTPGKIGKRAGPTFSTLPTGVPGSAAAGDLTIGKNYIDEQLNSGSGKSAETYRQSPVNAGLWTARPPTTRMAQAITLYMPPSVKVSYKSNYKNSEIGVLAGGSGDIIESFARGTGDWSTISKLALTTAGAAGTASAETLAPGSATLAQLSVGAIIGSKMEVLFTDVGRRSFSYSFNFIPKSEDESRVVYDIVQTFKEHMLPEHMSALWADAGGSAARNRGYEGLKFSKGRLLKMPDTFDIFYFYHSNENPFLNRISTCYLTSLDVDYGGEKYVTYEPTTLNGQSGPPPQRTNISLAFTEIETITRERAKQGF